MLISKNFHKKSSEVSIKTRSTPASLSSIGQVTKHTTVKWSIAKGTCIIQLCFSMLLAALHKYYLHLSCFLVLQGYIHVYIHVCKLLLVAMA